MASDWIAANSAWNRTEWNGLEQICSWNAWLRNGLEGLCAWKCWPGVRSRKAALGTERNGLNGNSVNKTISCLRIRAIHIDVLRKQ